MPDLTTEPSVDIATRIVTDSLRIHFASLKKGRGTHRKHAPLVFTEHGAIMAATVLSSPQAV
jgi:hypothetical protein